MNSPVQSELSRTKRRQATRGLAAFVSVLGTLLVGLLGFADEITADDFTSKDGAGSDAVYGPQPNPSQVSEGTETSESLPDAAQDVLARPERKVASPAVPSSPPAAPTPFYATVSADRLKLRTGPSLNYHAYSSLGRDDGVVVVEARGPWRRIVIPHWETLFVHKKYVDLGGAHLAAAENLSRPVSGAVSATRLVVRVLPERKHEAAGLLSNGATVSVRGRKGEWLAIAPTAETYAWVHRKYLKFQRPLGPTDVVNAWRASLGNWKKHWQETRQKETLLRGGTAAASAGSERDVGTTSAVSATVSPTRNTPRSARSSNTNRSSADRGSCGTENDPCHYRPLSRRGGRGDQVDRLIQRARALIAADGTSAQATSQSNHLGIHKRDTQNRTIQQRNDNHYEHSIAQVENPRFDRKRERVDQVGARRAGGAGSASSEKSLRPHDRQRANGRLTFLRRDPNGQDVYCLSHGNRVLYYLKTSRGSEIKLDSFRDQQVGVYGSIHKLDPKYGADLILVSNIRTMTTQ